jgi:hypothetical protein
VQLGQQHLADAGAVQVHPPTDLGEHPHGVPRRHLRDVDDPVAVEHGQVRRLPDGVDQPGQVRLGPRGEHPRRELPQVDQPRPEDVAP